MALYIYVVLLLFLNYTLAENCVIDNTPEYITWEKKVLEDLKCGYNRHQAPKEATTVNVTLFIRSYHFDGVKGVMTAQAWVEFLWKDERLKWDPEKHHGINETDMSHNFFIWTPNIGIANSEDVYHGYAYFHRYILKSNGVVLCRILVVQDTWCNVKLTDWPYDVQECSLEFTSKDTTRQATNYTLNFVAVVLESESAEWNLIDYKHVPGNGVKKQAKLSFFLLREAVGLSAIVIWPVFVLTILSMLSLCLDVRRKVRLELICFSLMGHYYFLTELAEDIPTESPFPPMLLVYYRGSVVLSVIILLSTFILSSMCKLKSTPHNYVKQINDFVYENNYRTYLVYPRWEFVDATVNSKSSSEDWVKFANIVNSVLIFFVVFAYIGLYATKIPKRTYYDAFNDYVSIILKPGEF